MDEVSKANKANRQFALEESPQNLKELAYLSKSSSIFVKNSSMVILAATSSSAGGLPNKHQTWNVWRPNVNVCRAVRTCFADGGRRLAANNCNTLCKLNFTNSAASLVILSGCNQQLAV